MSVIPFRGRVPRAEIDDMIDRALTEASDGERWLNPPRPLATSTIYLLPRAARQRLGFQAGRTIPADTMRAIRRAYAEMRAGRVDALYARHSAIASALVEWGVRP